MCGLLNVMFVPQNSTAPLACLESWRSAYVTLEKDCILNDWGQFEYGFWHAGILIHGLGARVVGRRPLSLTLSRVFALSSTLSFALSSWRVDSWPRLGGGEGRVVRMGVADAFNSGGERSSCGDSACLLIRGVTGRRELR